MKRFLACILILSLCAVMVGCSSKLEKERVLIYSGAEEFRNEMFQKMLNEAFPDYDIVIEPYSTGPLAAKLLAEGKDTACDIAFEIEYGYIDKLASIFADLAEYDTSIFTQDAVYPGNKFLPGTRNGCAIIINPEVLEKKGVPKPASYQDLLDPQYKGLISMPDPSSSGTGYNFLRALVNAWGEEEAFSYFKQLKENIKQFTSSGSGPVSALMMGEVGIGLSIIAQTVTEINKGVNLEILFFEEGAPHNLYGYGMIEGKQTREPVKKVFDYFYQTLVEEDKRQCFPEKIYKDKDFTLPNFPTDIQYADMGAEAGTDKERLLERWKEM